MLKVAIIGYGGIAGAHAPSWGILEERGKAKLVAVCDITEERFHEKQETNISTGRELPPEVRTYTDYNEMLDKEELDLVDICVPTPLHSKIAVDALKKGVNVQCEKPMARTSAQAEEMIRAAENSGKKLVIGLGLRFASEYAFIKDAITSGKFGKPLAALFTRVSGPPLWSRWNNWYMDHDLSGGCLLDMHIHDVDMIRYLFGEPDSVSCTTADVYAGDDIVHSRFFYDGLTVTAIGDWSQEGISFCAEYKIAFEQATVTCSNGHVVVYPRNGGEAWEPSFDADNFFTKELDYVTGLVANGGEATVSTPDGAMKSLKLCEYLMQSAAANGNAVKCVDLK